MRTFFDLVLGTLLIVAKAFFHALISAVGIAALCAAVVMVGVYAWRRRIRPPATPPESPQVIPIDR